MADKRVTVTIEAVDKASSTIKSIGSQLSSLGKLGDIKGLSNLGSTIDSIGKAFSGIKGKAGIAVAGITTVVGGFNKLYSASKQSFVDGLSKLGSICKTIVSGIAGAGKAFLSFAGEVANADLSFAGLAKTSMGYDQTLERIGIKAGATDGEMAKLGKTIQTLTTDTVYSMDEIAGAAEYMVQNGRTASQVVEELGSVAGLATTGNIDLAKSADIVASSMNMFSRQGLSAKQVANLFAKAANTSGANVENLAKSLENCGPQAAALNIPFEELMATLATMGDNAIKGGKAGTALKNLFQRMAAPTKEAASAIKEFGLETAQAKIVSGDLKGGLLEMKKALDLNKISSDEQQKAIKQLAGAYGAAGLTSVLNTATDELMTTFKAMEDGLVSTNDLENGMKKLMGTIQGQVMRFSANVQLAFYNLYTQANSSIAKVMDVFNNFLSMLNEGAGIRSALKYLETEFNKIPKILSNAINNGIKGIDKFINGGSLNSILNIGSNIVKGITSGINKAYNSGALSSSISGLISKVCDWITTNAPRIQKAGQQIIDAIKQGIEDNKEKIKTALDAIIGVMNTWAQGSAEIKSLCGTFAGTLIDGFVEQIGIKAKGKGAELWNAFFSDIEPPATASESISNFIAKAFEQGFSEPPKTTLQTVGDWVGNIFRSIFGGEAYAAEVESGGTKAAEGISKGIDQGKGQIETTTNAVGQIFGQSLVNAVQQAQNQLSTAFTGIVNSARTAFIDLSNIVRNQMVNSTNIVRNQAVNMSNIFRNQFVSMANIVRNQFVNVANIVRNQMVNACNIVRSQCVNMTNIFRSQFVSMSNVARNQMVNVANIVRNQMINVGNIIRNQITNAANSVRTQCTNMSNIFRNQFVSMANVARNQMVNVSNIIRNQAVSWSNVIRNQVQNARNTFTQQFISMGNVARTQMVNVSNIVRNQAMRWSNIIRNQAQSARNALTSSFMSMAAVARNQMANVLSVVQSYMSRIAATCNRTLTLKVNINKTETTTKKVVVEKSPKSLNMPQASSLSASGYTRSASSIGLGTLVGALSSASTGSNRAISIEVPLVLEGREIARASAIYTREELARLEKRNNRKRGE